MNSWCVLALLAIVFGSQLKYITCECPGKNCVFEEIGGTCYYLSFKHNQKQNWTGAKSFCQDLGRQVPEGWKVALAEVGGSETCQSDSLLLHRITENEEFATWLGASDLEAEGSWKWVTSGRDLPLWNPLWRDHQPSDINSIYNGDCLVAYNSLGDYQTQRANFHDADCTQEHAFVCQIMKEDIMKEGVTASSAPYSPSINAATYLNTQLNDFKGCPNGEWQENQGNCYYFSSDSYGASMVTWQQANGHCKTLGGNKTARLAELDDPSNTRSDEWLMQQIRDKGEQVYLGAYDHTEGDDWIWLSGRELSLANAKWGPDQPNHHGGRQYCLSTIREGVHAPKRQYYNDADCDGTYHYVCQLFD